MGACLLAACLIALAPAPPEGAVTGRLAWPKGAAIPENPAVDVRRDVKACLAKGPIRQDELIVHPKNRGIRNAAFFLVDADDPAKVLKAPPTRKLAKSLEITVPCCKIEPRVSVLAPGQSLVIDNKAVVTHAVQVHGGPDGPNIARLVPPDTREDHGTIKPRLMPMSLSCPIHPWMRGYVFAPPSPYFAVTDADGRFTITGVPKGRYRLIGWHERIGWIDRRPRPGAPPGRVIEVKSGPVDLGVVEREVRDE